MTDDVFGEVIFAYTRAQAIEDGVLIDVSSLAKEAGFRYPVALTSAAWHWIEPPEETIGQDATGRLWDLLNVLRYEIRKSKGDRIDFKVLFEQGSGEAKALVDFYALCGPGDSAEPVITVMLPDED